MPSFAPVDKAASMAHSTCSLVRRELHETIRAHLSSPHPEAHDLALAHRLERIESMLVSMQSRQEAQHSEMLLRQEQQHAELVEIAARQKEHHSQVMSVLHKVLAAVRMQTGLLQALLQGESECPPCATPLPTSRADSYRVYAPDGGAWACSPSLSPPSHRHTIHPSIHPSLPPSLPPCPPSCPPPLTAPHPSPLHLIPCVRSAYMTILSLTSLRPPI